MGPEMVDHGRAKWRGDLVAIRIFTDFSRLHVALLLSKHRRILDARDWIRVLVDYGCQKVTGLTCHVLAL
jgi:hypothetical protein